MTHLDEHGQPLNRTFSELRNTNRVIDELIGISKGVVSDSAVNEREAEFILQWIESNAAIMNHWPANQLYARIKAMMLDGHLDSEEKEELISLLQSAVGGNSVEALMENNSATLPLTMPEPPIIFDGRSFCLTGMFFYGVRSKCEREIKDRGGLVSPSVTLNLNYLVIGTNGSSDWVHSPYGRKIEKAVEYRERGASLAIVSEKHWIDHVLKY